VTRIAGTNIIKAPCCGALYSTTAFASINFMASEHWTDGQDENSLSQSDGGLRRCACGCYFLSGYAERVGFIPKNSAQPQEQSEYSIAKVFGKIGKLLIAEDKAKPQTIRKLPSQWAANETVITPKAQSVTGAAIVELLDSKPQDNNLLIQARRLYWRYLNDQFRDEYRAYRDINKDSFPAYVPSTAQMNNMEHLAALLENHDMVDELELGELYREMGKPLKARAKLAKLGDDDRKLCEMQLSLLKQGYAGPARFKY
jgi:uncharacterized protein (UPF0147 family)